MIATYIARICAILDDDDDVQQVVRGLPSRKTLQRQCRCTGRLVKVREHREGVHPAMIPPHRFLPPSLPRVLFSLSFSLLPRYVTLTRRVKLKTANCHFFPCTA